ncbi:MAG: DNA polymerase I [Chloroflexi bacterium]|nr:DNA polymerase I [Chloroflexota bacterium]
MPPARERPLLMLIDGHALAYRAYYALPPLHTSRNEPVNAVYGFINMLQKVIGAEKPDYVGSSFDLGEATHRIEEYSEYKGTREESPEDFRSQMSMILELMEALEIPVFHREGYEADDCIATVAKKAEAHGMDVLIVTGDLDLLQLVDEHITVLTPKKGISSIVRYNTEAVIERFGIGPELLVDMKSMSGDSSDNIPGVPGIGVKTAAMLIREHGDLEGIFENMEKLRPNFRDKISANKEDVIRYKKLLTLHKDLPIEFNPGELEFHGLDTTEAEELYRRLEFRSLKKEPVVSAGSVVNKEPVVNKAAGTERYVTVADDKSLNDFIEKAGKAPGSAYYISERGMGIFLEGEGGFYFPGGKYMAGEDTLPLSDPSDTIRLKKALAALMECPATAGYRIKEDLFYFGDIPGDKEERFFDVKLAGYLLDPEGSLRLADLFLKYLPAEHAWEPVEDGDKDKVASSLVSAAGMMLALKKETEKRLRETDMYELFSDIEMPLVFVLNRMEREGVRIDEGYLAGLSGRMDKDIKKIEAEIYGLAGHEFNIGSPRQVGTVLFEEMGLPVQGKTSKTGAASTDAMALMQVRDKHPIVEKILNYRELTKLKSTYVDALPKVISKLDGRLHSSFNQMGTATGRLSSSEPNLQNIPARGEWGKLIRRAFIAEKGSVIVGADYSQIELRVLAHMSKDPTLVEAFKDREDIHRTTAASVFGVPRDEVTPDMRRKAKEINFGIIYGMRAHGLAQRLNISREEAREHVDRYLDRFASVKNFINEIFEEAREKGYVETLLRRRRYLPGINSKNFHVRSATERVAINAPIQGTSADIIKLAMVKVDREIAEKFPDKKDRPRLILSIHDELLFEAKKEFVPQLVEVVREVMEGAFPLDVPLVVDINAGENWAGIKN